MSTFRSVFRCAGLTIAILLAGAPGAEAASAAKARSAQHSRGQRIDITTRDLDIRKFFNAMAEVSRRNIVADDSVSGKVTVRLRNVSWDEALDIVLRTKGLGRQEVGSIIRIAPMSVLRSEPAWETEDANW